MIKVNEVQCLYDNSCNTVFVSAVNEHKDQGCAHCHDECSLNCVFIWVQDNPSYGPQLLGTCM